MRIPSQEHLKHPWRVHNLLEDFKLEDVWRFPVELDPHETLADFRDQFSLTMEKLEKSGPAGWLFKLRLFLGQIFGWDGQENQEEILLKSGSIRERYAIKNALKPEALPTPGKEDFIPVYDLGEESLAEIDNATVHATLHLSRVPIAEKLFTVQMAVYVKPKGLFGQFYMLLIKPFRYWIVYPTMMRMVGKQWEKR